jgi:hypothetical protein
VRFSAVSVRESETTFELGAFQCLAERSTPPKTPRKSLRDSDASCRREIAVDAQGAKEQLMNMY